GGRLHEARRVVIEHCAQSDYLDVVAPQGALYAFPSVRAAILPTFDDATFALELLERESILIVPGSGFNIDARNHFRMTLLPQPEQLHDVFAGIERVLTWLAARPSLQRHVA
ncbi:MAG: aminotransferase class I/II-fold pyridoxal phosphate-dependent enzyme, partial [Rudaea sp.]